MDSFSSARSNRPRTDASSVSLWGSECGYRQSQVLRLLGDKGYGIEKQDNGRRLVTVNMISGILTARH
jgi:hypothetical protein